MCKLTKEMVMVAIPGSCGIISEIAKQCGCSWHTVKRYLDDPLNREEMDAFKAERETMLDLAEHHLMEAVKAGSPWAVKFFLSRLGKTRGYREKKKEELDLELKERTEQWERDHLADLTSVLMNYSDSGISREALDEHNWKIMYDEEDHRWYVLLVVKDSDVKEQYSLKALHFVDGDCRVN